MPLSYPIAATIPLLISITATSAAGPSAPFAWGTATAAYQVEGSRNVSGRQPSVWDCFDTPMRTANGVDCAAIKSTKPDKTVNVFQGENAATADADYLNYNATIAELGKFGFGAYRMSISWSRVLTYNISSTAADAAAKPVATENKEGIEHYRRVLTALKAAGIDVALTMWHWDTPEALENYAYANPACIRPGGGKDATGSFWLCPDSNAFFQTYAELLVKHFGPLVKFWITLNEPLTIVENGYSGSAPHAPGRCSDRTKCWDGDDATEPFIVAHNLLRAHAVAFRAWNASAAKLADSACGITLNGDYAKPVDPTNADDIAAAERSHEYQMGIFADPVFLGKWPPSVVAGVGANLPALDPLIHGTHVDIYFQNHYTTNYVWAGGDEDRFQGKSASGSGFLATANISHSGYHPQTNKPIGLPSSNGWLFSYAPGLPKLQAWLHKRYPTAAFVVTENGWGNASATMEEDVHDIDRCNYYRSYIGAMAQGAHDNGIDVRGYFAWSIMDNYEWADGYSTRFGLTYVDYATQARTPKLSMKWFKGVTQLKALPANGADGLPPCEGGPGPGPAPPGPGPAPAPAPVPNVGPGKESSGDGGTAVAVTLVVLGVVAGIGFGYWRYKKRGGQAGGIGAGLLGNDDAAASGGYRAPVDARQQTSV